MKTLKLTHNTTKAASDSDSSADRAPFVCPLNLKEMNGVQPFVYLWTCGCVFSQGGLRAVSSTPPPREDAAPSEDKDKDDADSSTQLDICPQCAKKYVRPDDIVLLNPPPEEEEKMFAAMLRRRAAEPKKSKKRKAAAVAESDATEPSKKSHAASAPSINRSIATASRAVAQSLAEEEVKRKAAMSDAVKSLYSSSDGPKKKQTFMTMGTFTRVRCSSSSTWKCADVISNSMLDRAAGFKGVAYYLLDVYHNLYVIILAATTMRCV